MIVKQDFMRAGLDRQQRYTFIKELEDAAEAVGVSRPSLTSHVKADGTWDVAGTLEGESAIVDELASRHYLGLPLI